MKNTNEKIVTTDEKYESDKDVALVIEDIAEEYAKAKESDFDEDYLEEMIEGIL